MFKFTQLKSLHLEITNNCQASCPMCTRNIHGGLENPLLDINSWSLEKYKTIVSPEVINQIDKVYFCGNFGDPLLNNNLLEMCEYTAEVDPSIQVRIHTNGSLRSKSWWKNLAEILPEDHMVVFALDGLADTHALYRIGTDFNKIIDNATAFIEAGGKAEWAFLRFKHNEHQVEEARLLAKELNFDSFVMKDSSRWLLDTKFPVYDKNKETTHHLEPSQYSELKFIDKKVIENYKSIVARSKINCHALDQKEVYIDAYGHLLPCCWLGSLPYIPIDHEVDVFAIKQEILKQYYDLVDSLGGIDSIDTTKRSIRDIVDSTEYQTIWDEYWNTKKLITCARACGRYEDNIISTPNDQFISRELLM